MSQPSQSYIQKIIKLSYSGVEPARLHMNLEQEFRARLCLECYQLFSENSAIPIRKLVRNIATRNYGLLMKNAEMGVESAVKMVEALGIKRDESGLIKPRSETALSNDIWVVNQLLQQLNTGKKYIHLKMVEDDIDWLRKHGRETGQWQAVNKAADKLMKINRDFQDDDDPVGQMPNPDINITGDVSVVKEGRESLTDEQRRELERKYGLTRAEVAQEYEEINGIMVPVENDDDDDAEADIFVENEMP